MKIYLSVAIALLAAAPVLAQNNATAPANVAEATPGAAMGNASDNVATTAVPDANVTAAAPAEPTAAAEPPPPVPQPQPSSFPWGVLGLVGLIGLLGSRKSAS